MYDLIVQFLQDIVNLLIPLIFIRVVADIFRDFIFNK